MSKQERALRAGEDEQGVILVLFGLILGVAVIIIAMVVDHSRETLTVNNLQRAADIAALNAVRRFDGTRDGWRNAKRAALLAIRQNPIFGAGALNGLRLNQGAISIYDGEDPRMDETRTEGEFGGVRVRVERGVYTWDPTLDSDRVDSDGDPIQGGFRFISLENAPNQEWNNAPAYIVANSVRVQVTLNSLETSPFGRLAGVGSYDDLSRVGQAVNHNQVMVPVLPLAIPYCQLLLNTDHLDNSGELTAEYQPEEQCKRELIFTEANPDGVLQSPPNYTPVIGATGGGEARREGLRRFKAYIRPPYINYGESGGQGGNCFEGLFFERYWSCMHFEIYGTLGIPSVLPNQVADSDDVVDALLNSSEAGMGMYFAPLERIDTFTNSQRQAIANWINSSPTTIREAFTRTSNEPPLSWKANDNYPAIKSFRPNCPRGPFAAPPPGPFPPDVEDRPCSYERNDSGLWVLDEGANLALRMASSNAQDTIVVNVDRQCAGWIRPDGTCHVESGQPRAFPLVHQSTTYFPSVPVTRPNPLINPAVNPSHHAAYTNPLCHDPDIAIDDIDQGKVQRALVMVVAPGNENFTYCDWENVVSWQPQVAVPPIAITEPRVVGFLEVNVFDFNLINLDAYFGGAETRVLNYEDMAPIAYRATATPKYLRGLNRTWDRAPGELDVSGTTLLNDVRDQINEYEEDHKGWQGCEVRYDPDRDDDDQGRCGRPPGLSFGDLRIAEEFLRCFDFSPLLEHNEFGNVLRNLSTLPTSDDCGSEDIVSCISQDTRDKADQMFAFIRNFFYSNIRALPDAHCIPHLYKDCPNPQDPDCFQELRSLRANYGCGGIRARLSCGDPIQPTLWQNGRRWSDAQPALVADD